jgi:toxin ParE1/3/4
LRARAVVLSVAAEADIDAVAAYSKEKWGAAQADSYLTKLEEGFDLLGRTPSIGRACDSIQPGLRRFEIEGHVVFYRIGKNEISVVRILHERMLPIRSRFEP